MNQNLIELLSLSKPSELPIFILHSVLEDQHPIIIRWLTSAKGITADEDTLFAILNSPINALNIDNFKNLNLLRIIARCLQNLGNSHLIGNFFLNPYSCIELIFTNEQLVKLFTVFDDNSNAILLTDSDNDELYYAVAEYLSLERIEFKTKASTIIECGFSAHIAKFFDDWDKAINIVCTPDELERWFLDEPLSDNLQKLLGTRCPEMHTVAVSLCENNLRNYIVKFWNTGYDNFKILQTFDDDDIELLIKSVSVSEIDSRALTFYLISIKE